MQQEPVRFRGNRLLNLRSESHCGFQATETSDLHSQVNHHKVGIPGQIDRLTINSAHYSPCFGLVTKVTRPTGSLRDGISVVNRTANSLSDKLCRLWSEPMNKNVWSRSCRIMAGIVASVCFVFNPLGRTQTLWTATGPLAFARVLHTAVLLPSGKVLVAGGLIDCVSFCYPTNTVEIYDPDVGVWRPTTSMTVARANHAAVLLRDGKVLVVGGYQGLG